MRLRTIAFPTAIALAAMTIASAASAATVNFTSAVATFSQTGFDVGGAIDADKTGGTGWAISHLVNPPTDTSSETALFGIDPVTGGPTDFTFVLLQNYGTDHTLGNFSLDYATDAGPTLTSAQNAFTITSATSLNGATLNFSGDHISATGFLPDTDTYTITAHANAGAPFTGIFLNVINDPAYNSVTGGPGRQPTNGNFVLNDISADAVAGVAGVPEPATWAMMLLGFGGLGAVLRHRRTLVSA
jgi:hypothetical protein